MGEKGGGVISVEKRLRGNLKAKLVGQGKKKKKKKKE